MERKPSQEKTIRNAENQKQYRERNKELIKVKDQLQKRISWEKFKNFTFLGQGLCCKVCTAFYDVHLVVNFCFTLFGLLTKEGYGMFITSELFSVALLFLSLLSFLLSSMLTFFL